MKILPIIALAHVVAQSAPLSSEPALTPTELREDLNLFRREFLERDRAFSPGDPARSQLTMLPAVARHDYRGGCLTYDECVVGVAQPGRPHGSPPQVAAVVRPMPIAIPTLAPDIPAPFTIKAFEAGRDPAVEAVAAALKQAPSGIKGQERR